MNAVDCVRVPVVQGGYHLNPVCVCCGKPSRGKRKVRKVGLKGNSSNVMLGVAQALVWSSASYVVSGTLYMREATGAAAV